MPRRRIVALGALLAFSAAFVQSVAIPRVARACDCVIPQLAHYVGRQDAVIVSGTVGARQGNLIQLAVETWYHGAQPRGGLWLVPADSRHGGMTAFNTCGLGLVAGERWFLAMSGKPSEPLSPSICSPGGQLGSPEGDELVARAEEIFGGGLAPPSAAPEAALPQPFDLTSLDGVAMAWLGAGVAAAVVILGLAIVVAGRRRIS